MVYNVRPRQTHEIPWGWQNTDSPWGKVVTTPKGDLSLPRLTDYFDFNTIQVGLFNGITLPDRTSCITTDFKAILSTAARLIGWERLLSEIPNLSSIHNEYLLWNDLFLRSAVKKTRPYLKYFVIGDDVGTQRGLMISPRLYRSWLLKYYESLTLLAHSHNLKVVFHSDGDVYDILDLLDSIHIDYFHPCQPVGKMTRLKGQRSFGRMRLIHESQSNLIANPMVEMHAGTKL